MINKPRAIVTGAQLIAVIAQATYLTRGAAGIAKNTAKEHGARSKVPAAQPAHTISGTLPGISPFPVIAMIAPSAKTAIRSRKRGIT